MDKERKLLKAAGILNCIIGGLSIHAPVGLPLILLGIYLYTESKITDEELMKNNIIYRFLAIITCFNVVSFAILLTIDDNIRKYERRVNGVNAPPKKVVYKVDSESKKIDILLKLGVGMVFISGILFATTTWSFINNYIKAFALIFLGAMFIVLSIFSEKKLKLYRSSFMYWLLGISFFILTIVGILYFGIFGNYLTYRGAGRSLAYAITLLSSAGFLFATYLKYPKTFLAYLSMSSATIALHNIMLYITQSTEISICIVTSIITALNIINRKENILNTYTKIISYALLPISISLCYDEAISLFIVSMVNIINFNYQAVLERDKNTTVINIIFTEILLFVSISKLNVINDLNVSLIMLLISIYTILININILKSDNNTKLANYIIYSVLSLGIVLASMISINYKITYNMIISSVIYLLTFTITRNGLFNSIKFEKLKYIEPLVLFFTVLSVPLTFMNNLSYIYVVATVALIYSIIGFISKEEDLSKIYLIYGIIGTIYVIQAFSMNKELLLVIMNLITALILFSKYDMKEDAKTFVKAITYIILLLSVYIPFVGMNILNISSPIIIITYIIITYLIAILLRKDHISKITNFQVIIPLLQLIEYFDFNNTITSILVSLTFLYCVVLFIKYFVKDRTAKNVILIVSLVIFLAEPFFLESIYGGIYIGIIGIVAIIYGFRKDEYTSIFSTGIILTILNIAYRLKGLWKLLPFWLYLLLGGLLIIGFVTYKEIKKK